jgi:hypothetical protein
VGDGIGQVVGEASLLPGRVVEVRSGVGGVVAKVHAPTVVFGDEDLGAGIGLSSCGADDHCQGKEDQENVSQGCSTIEFERELLSDAAWMLQFSAES